MTVPFRRPSSSRRSRLDERHLDGGLGTDGSQGSEPDAEVADLGGIALQDVERGRRAVAAQKSPLVGDESRAPPGTRSWYVPRDGENTPR